MKKKIYNGVSDLHRNVFPYMGIVDLARSNGRINEKKILTFDLRKELIRATFPLIDFLRGRYILLFYQKGNVE